MKDEFSLSESLSQACAQERERCDVPLESPRVFAAAVCELIQVRSAPFRLGLIAGFGAALALVLGFLLTAYGVQQKGSTAPPALSIFQAADEGGLLKTP